MVTVNQFIRADFPGLNNYLDSSNWSFILNLGDIDNMISRFYEILYIGIDTFVPKKIVKNNNYPKWFDPDLRKAVALKNKAILKLTQMFDV